MNTVDAHNHARNEPQLQHKENNTQSWFRSLPALLRTVGAIAILISLYTFLMRGWEGSGDLFRYLILLSQTCLLSVLAFVSNYFFREGRGPRLLIMLSLISSIVNFAILGAFIYAATTPLSLAFLPDYVVWRLADTQTLILLSLFSFIVLLPMIISGFRVLSRGMSKRMSGLFIIANIALLAPVRSPEMIAIIAVVLLMLTHFLIAQSARTRIEAKTLEGKFALFVQFVPIAVLLSRSLWLHGLLSGNVILFMAITTALFVIMRHISLYLTPGRSMHEWSHFISMLLAILSGVFFHNYLDGLHINHAFLLIISSLISAGMIYDISNRSRKYASAYHIFASLQFSYFLLLALFKYGGWISFTANLIVGIGFIYLSFQQRKLSMLFAGLTLVTLCMVKQSLGLLEYFHFGYWSVLAGSGILAIILSSALEAKGRKIVDYVHTHKKTYSKWSY